MMEDSSLHHTVRFTNASVAFDLGAYEFRVAIVGRTDTGSTKLIMYGQVKSDGIEYNCIVDAEKLQKRLLELMVQIRASLPLETQIEAAYIGYSGLELEINNTDSSHRITKSNRSNLNQVTEEHIDKLKSTYCQFLLKGEHIVQTLIPAGYSCDSGIWEENVIGKEAAVVCSRYYAISLPKQTWDQLSNSFRKLPVGPKGIVYSPLTSDKVILEPIEKQNGALVFDIGFNQTTLLYAKDLKWKQVKSIEQGSNAINDAIVAYLKRNNLPSSMDIAEKLKREYGLNRPPLKLNEIGEPIPIDPIVLDGKYAVDHDELVHVIRESITQLISEVYLKLEEAETSIHARVAVFIGGGSNINGLQSYMSSIFKIPVRLGSVNNIQDLTREANHQGAINVLGIAMYGLETYRSSTSWWQKSVQWVKGKNSEDFVIKM